VIGRALEWLAYVGVRVFVIFVAYLPRTAAYTLCKTLAAGFYYLDSRHRHIGMVNLRIAFPEQTEAWRKRTLKESFKLLGVHAVEICKFSRITPEGLARRIQYESEADRRHYLTARASGRGVLFITAHISAWELLPAAHAVMTRPLHVVVRPLNNPYLNRWVTELRTRFGNHVVSKKNALRRLMRLLANGEDVGLLIDQNVQEKDGVYTTMFGHSACAASGPAALALKTGSPVIAGFLLPAEKPGHFRIRFYPPLDLIQTGDYERDVVANTGLFMSYIEKVVREHPACWLWGHRRFQTQPDGRHPYVFTSRARRADIVGETSDSDC